MIPNMDIEIFNRLLQLGAQQPEVIDETNGTPFVVVPKDSKVEPVGHLYPPKRIERTVALLDASSFSDYVNRYKLANTVIFAKVTDTSGEFRSILDYHHAAPEVDPAYCRHVANYTPEATVEFKSWMQADRKRLCQVDFAVWLEDNSGLLKDPTGAELLELITTLHGHSEARFNQTFRLKDGGCKLQYDEDVLVRGTSTTSSKPGEIELPDHITAGISPFQGAPLYEVRARMKVRIENRKLQLWFETINPHKIIRDSLLETMRTIAEKTGIIPFLGIP